MPTPLESLMVECVKFYFCGREGKKSGTEYKRARNLILVTTERFDREGIGGGDGEHKRLFAAPTSLMRLRPIKSRICRGEGCNTKGPRNNLTRRWRIRVFEESPTFK